MILDTDQDIQKKANNIVCAIESLKVDLKYALRELLIDNSFSNYPLRILKFNFFVRSFDEDRIEVWSTIVNIEDPKIYETTFEKLEKLIIEKHVYISFKD